MPLLSRLINATFRPTSVAGSVGISSAGAMFQRGLGLARGIALAWLLDAAQYGLLGLALAVLNVLLPLCSLGIYEGVMRYAPEHEQAGKVRAFLRLALIATACVTIMTLLVLLPFRESLGPQLFEAAEQVSAVETETAATTAESARLMGMVVLCLISLIPYHVLLGLLKGLRLFRAMSIAEVAAAVLFTGLAVAAPLFGWATASTVLLAYTISNLALVLLFAPALSRRADQFGRNPDEMAATPTPPTLGTTSRPRTTRSPSGAARLLRFSLFSALAAVLWHFISAYPMWTLLRATNRESLGAFLAMRTIAQLLQIGAILLAGIVGAYTTHWWEGEGAAHAQTRWRPLLKLAVLAVLAAAVLMSWAQPLAVVIFPDALASGAAAYRPLLLFFALAGAVQLLAVGFHLRERPEWTAVAWGVGAVVTVVAMRWLLSGVGGVEGDAAISPADPGTYMTRVAWAGSAGLVGTLLVALLMLKRQRVAPDARTGLLLACLLAIGLPPGYATALLILVAAIAWRTSLLLTGEERQMLRDRLIHRGAR
jgi:O-antigen/teichoic acid export membrane protein